MTSKLEQFVRTGMAWAKSNGYQLRPKLWIEQEACCPLVAAWHAATGEPYKMRNYMQVLQDYGLDLHIINAFARGFDGGDNAVLDDYNAWLLGRHIAKELGYP